MSRPRRAAVDQTWSEEIAHDARLLAGIGEGDPDAFAALWTRYGQAVHGLCRAVVGERAAAEDAVQETFLRIWRGAGSYDPARGVPAAWVMAIARNVARTAARPRPAPAIWPETPVPDEVEGVVDRLWLREALGGLSQPKRVALELAYFADLSHAEVAARLGEPLGTVKARIRRALLRLAAQAGGR